MEEAASEAMHGELKHGERNTGTCREAKPGQARLGAGNYFLATK